VLDDDRDGTISYRDFERGVASQSEGDEALTIDLAPPLDTVDDADRAALAALADQARIARVKREAEVDELGKQLLGAGEDGDADGARRREDEAARGAEPDRVGQRRLLRLCAPDRAGRRAHQASDALRADRVAHRHRGRRRRARGARQSRRRRGREAEERRPATPRATPPPAPTPRRRPGVKPPCRRRRSLGGAPTPLAALGASLVWRSTMPGMRGGARRGGARWRRRRGRRSAAARCLARRRRRPSRRAKVTPLTMPPTEAPQMIRLHAGGYLRADVPLPPIDEERRVPVWSVTVCFKLTRLPAVPLTLLSVGRKSGAITISADGRVTVAEAHFGPKDRDGRGGDSDSDDEDGAAGSDDEDGAGEARVRARASQSASTRSSPRRSSRRSTTSRCRCSARRSPGEDMESFELGDSVQLPTWNEAEDAEKADSDDDDDDDNNWCGNAGGGGAADGKKKKKLEDDRRRGRGGRRRGSEAADARADARAAAHHRARVARAVGVGRQRARRRARVPRRPEVWRGALCDVAAAAPRRPVRDSRAAASSRRRRRERRGGGGGWSPSAEAPTAAAASAAARDAADHGVYLFGTPGAGVPVSCTARFVELRPRMLNEDDAKRLHVLHGVWQCPADGVRNGPQVKLCAHCGAERRKSAERPPGDADPGAPGHRGCDGRLVHRAGAAEQEARAALDHRRLVRAVQAAQAAPVPAGAHARESDRRHDRDHGRRRQRQGRALLPGAHRAEHQAVCARQQAQSGDVPRAAHRARPAAVFAAAHQDRRRVARERGLRAVQGEARHRQAAAPPARRAAALAAAGGARLGFTAAFYNDPDAFVSDELDEKSALLLARLTAQFPITPDVLHSAIALVDREHGGGADGVWAGSAAACQDYLRLRAEELAAATEELSPGRSSATRSWRAFR
jgi:hypothetical protein